MGGSLNTEATEIKMFLEQALREQEGIVEVKKEKVIDTLQSCVIVMILAPRLISRKGSGGVIHL